MPSQIASLLPKLADLPSDDGRIIDTIAGVLLRQFAAINRLQRRLEALEHPKKKRGRPPRRVQEAPQPPLTDRFGFDPDPRDC
jgi:hypothetical protein